MITTDSILTYLDQSEAAARRAHDELMALTKAQRAQRGYTLLALTVDQPGPDADTWWLTTADQLSRYTTGDAVLLTHDTTTIPATVLDHDLTRLLLRTDRALNPSLPWDVEPAYRSFVETARRATTTIDPFLGQFFLDALNGIPQPPPPPEPEATDLLAALEQEAGLPLDADQRTAFLQALTLPTVWALQGPPGTGKTLVAAYVAEALARTQRRVLVLAHSHHAVNRALSEIAHHFPTRTLIKVAPPLRPTPPSPIKTIPFTAYEPTTRHDLTRPIVGMTVHTALLLATIYNTRFDVIIVDESTQIPLAEGALLGLLGFSILLFGDPAQLNTIAPADLQDDPLATSLIHQYAAHNPLTFLGATYRLNAPLADLAGRTYYPDAHGSSRLHSAPTAATRSLPLTTAPTDPTWSKLLDPARPAVWLRTDEENTWQSSPQEAALAVALTDQLIAAGIPPRNIAIVTPFRQQVQAIGRLLAAHPHRPRLGTVETMQGQSVEVVIISLAASHPGYLDRIAPWYFSPNRWNVALTRARTKAIIIGSRHLTRAFPPGSTIAGRLNTLTTLLNQLPTIEGNRLSDR